MTTIRGCGSVRRANFFDVGCLHGGLDVAGRTVSHNLGVAPEMMMGEEA